MMKKSIVILALALSLGGCKKEEVLVQSSNCGRIIEGPEDSKASGIAKGFPVHEFLIRIQYQSGVIEWISIPREKFVQLMAPGQKLEKYPLGYVMKIGSTFCK